MLLHFNLIGIFIFCLGLTVWQFFLPHTAFCGFIGLVVYLMGRWGLKKNVSAADVIFAASFCLNLWYVTASWGNVRQYDYYNFFMQADYFVQNGFFVQNPLSYAKIVYFQPPLWGILGGICMKTAEFDSVRFISLFAVSGTGVIFWRLAEKMRFSLRVQLGLFILFCFFPANGMMANLVNNDALTYFLMTAAVYFAYNWQVEGTMRQAVILSGLLFLGGMTKFSALMLVPAVAVLGLLKLMTADKKFSLFLWGQFALIGAGAAAGFFWGWFLLYYGLPLVPPPVDVSFQSMSGYVLAERLLSFKTAASLFINVQAGQVEPNVWLALIKTSLFGEWVWQGELWARIMYFCGGLLVLLFLGSFPYLWKYPLGKGFAFNVFVVVLTFSVLGAWVNFWLDYPYFCSSEFRYVIILWPMSLLWLGNFLTQKSLPKILFFVSTGLIMLFIAARVMLYLNTI